MPELPPQAMGRTLPFVRASAQVSVEDIYRLSQDAEKPSELILKAARSGADELAAALRSLDGKPYRGFALLYAAQKADTLVAEDPNQALAACEASRRGGRDTPARESRKSAISTPAPRQAVQAEAALLESQALLQKGDAKSAREAIRPARDFFRESGDLGFGAALCDYYEGAAVGFERDYAAAERLLKRALAIFGGIRSGSPRRAVLTPRSGRILVQKGDFDRRATAFRPGA